MQQVGIIGLGRMGSAIAQRMTAQGYSVVGWTRSGRSVEGVNCVQDLESLVTDSETLILSLFDDDAVSEVLKTLLTFDLQGRQIIETSTVMPQILKRYIDLIVAAGATAVDAPISGGPEMVLAGSCGVFIGGDEASASQARDTLAAISGRIAHVGPLGTGLVMKVINNSMIQVYFSGLSDMMPLAKEAGLPLETTLRILGAGPAGMPMLTNRLPKILGEDEAVGFTINAAFKDNDVCQRVAESFGVNAPTLKTFDDLKDAVAKAGFGERDPAALVNLAYDGTKEL